MPLSAGNPPTTTTDVVKRCFTFLSRRLLSVKSSFVVVVVAPQHNVSSSSRPRTVFSALLSCLLAERAKPHVSGFRNQDKAFNEAFIFNLYSSFSQSHFKAAQRFHPGGVRPLTAEPQSLHLAFELVGRGMIKILNYCYCTSMESSAAKPVRESYLLLT